MDDFNKYTGRFRLQEAILGTNAYIFHRTGKRFYGAPQLGADGQPLATDPIHLKALEFIEHIAKEGFKPGSGAMYGTGLYSTYEEDIQFSANMSHYGPYIIQFYTKLRRTIILDEDQAKKVWKVGYGLIEQLKKCGAPASELFHNQEIVRLAKELDTKTFRGGVSSSVADPLSRNSLFIKMVKNGNVEGLVFSGNHDGKVCVIYDPAIAIPISWTYNSDGVKPKKVIWHKIEETDLTKKRMADLVNPKLSAKMNYAELIKKYDKAEVKVAEKVYGSNVKGLLTMLQKKVIHPNSHFIGKFLIFHLIDLDNEKIVLEYLKLGGSTNFEDDMSHLYPIPYAIQFNKMEALKALLQERFLNVNAKYHGETALDWAKRMGNTNAIKMLTARGATQ